MLKLTLITVGKLKDGFYREAQAHYSKLLGGFCDLEIVEVADEPITGNDTEKIITKESAKLEALIRSDALNVALDPTGKEYGSPEFSAWLMSNKDTGRHIRLFVGGPYGLSRDFLVKCDQNISLSKLTFPHQLARIVLLEQLYRGFTIGEGRKYHY
jgi:23S rRNA (pseudouridine1915-N3)-methyltransferase